MTIDELYRYIQFIANKEQRGFIKPTEFNLLADRAQMELFTKRYNNLKEATSQNYKNTQVKTEPGSQYTNSQKSLDDLRPFINHNVALTYGTNAFDYPTDYIHMTGLFFNKKNVKIVGEDKIYGILNSSIVPPTESRPVAVLDRDGVHLYTSSDGATVASGDLRCTYLRRPDRPQWAYVEINNNPIYDPTNSTQLGFPEQTHNELAVTMLTYIGVNVKDSDIYTLATTKAKEGV